MKYLYINTIWKFLAGLIGAGFALLLPVKDLIYIVLTCTAIDFAVGIMASHKRHYAAKPRTRRVWWTYIIRPPEWLQSKRMWRTGEKCVLIVIGIYMFYQLDITILENTNRLLARIFAGFISAVELYSFLENAAYLTDYAPFRAAKKIVRDRVEKETGIDLDQVEKEG